jgi:RHS repeat-associated protein
MQMPGRTYNATDGYRYGFNGKENDNEVKGEGNQQDYGFRIYDPRLGRFLSVDPLTADYPWYTPYQFAGNNPIKFIDLDGGEPKDPGTYNGQGAIAPQIVDGNTCEGTDNYRWTWNNNQWNYTTFNVTNGELTSIFDKGNADALKQIETSVNLDGSKFGINSKTSLAHFLSQAGHEVDGFTKGFDIEEGLNYNVDGLIGTFGKYFYKGVPVDGKLDASLYGRIEDVKGKVTQRANKEAIANQAYGNRMGNGDFASGEGYKYRGRGMFQLTGKANYTAFNTFLNEAGVDIVAKPELILTTEYAIKSAMWYYKTAVVDKLKIESATVKEVSIKVNGDPPNGLADRESIYNTAIEKLK